MATVKPRIKKHVNPPGSGACFGCMFKAGNSCNAAGLRTPLCVRGGEAWVWINVAKEQQDRPVNSESPVEQEQV